MAHEYRPVGYAAALCCAAIIIGALLPGDPDKSAAIPKALEPEIKPLKPVPEDQTIKLGPDNERICSITPSNLQYIVMNMMIYQFQGQMDCKGELVSQSRIGTIKQNVYLFRGKNTGTGVAAVFHNNRLVHLERNF